MRVVTMDDEYSYSLHMAGTATTLHDDDPESDGEARVRALHEVVAEITGEPMEEAPRRRIGFV